MCGWTKCHTRIPVTKRLPQHGQQHQLQQQQMQQQQQQQSWLLTCKTFAEMIYPNIVTLQQSLAPQVAGNKESVCAVSDLQMLASQVQSSVTAEIEGSLQLQVPGHDLHACTALLAINLVRAQ